ncbi:MAG TPA: Flp pilus assembly protein CpaB [Granulicella sp.]
MSSRRLLLALFTAVVISGVFTLWFARRFAAHPAPKTAKLQYVAAAKELDAGQTLSAPDLTTIDWPGNMPLPGAIRKPSEVMNRTLLFPLAKGQPILQRQLSAPGMIGLSTRIPDGMRAVSLKSDQVVGVAGFLLPGTHTDVLVTYHVANTAEPVTTTVLQNAQVLAAGQNTQPDPSGKPTTVSVVTLLASPADAQRVVLASTQGSVHFVLRNGSDNARLDDPPVHLSALGGMAALPKPAAPPREKLEAETRKPYTVETVRGEKQSVESFQP